MDLKELTDHMRRLPLLCERAQQCSPERTAPCDALCMRNRAVALIEVYVQSQVQSDQPVVTIDGK